MFPTVSLTWECLLAGGVTPRVLQHSSATAGDNIYVYGGVLKGDPTDELLVFNTGSEAEEAILLPSTKRKGSMLLSLRMDSDLDPYFLSVSLTWTPVRTRGSPPPAL